MYNGIGLSTPRGSATSGHVTKNLSYVRPEFYRGKIRENSGKSDIVHDRSEEVKIDTNILDHKRKREIEAIIFEEQENWIEKGLSDEEIEEKVRKLRKKLEKGNQNPSSKKAVTYDTHELAIRKEYEIKRMRDAFNIKSKNEGEQLSSSMKLKEAPSRESVKTISQSLNGDERERESDPNGYFHNHDSDKRRDDKSYNKGIGDNYQLTSDKRRHERSRSPNR